MTPPAVLRDRGLRALAPWLATFAAAGVLVALHVALERVLLHAGRLPEPAFEGAYLSLELARRLGWPGALAGAAAAFLLVRSRRARASWRELGCGRGVYWLVMVTAGVLVWDHATRPYNFYFAEGYALDRALLVLFLVLFGWRPAFVLPLLLVLIPLIAVESHPLPGFLWAIDLLPLRVLVLFLASYAVFVAHGRWNRSLFLLVALSIVAANYWWPGFLKARMNWMEHGKPYLLPLGAHAHGWMSFLSPETVVQTVRYLAPMNPALVAATLAIECGAVFCLATRGIARAALLAWVVFHAGTFVLMGYCFWKWVAIEAVLFFILRRARHAVSEPIFSPPIFVASAVLITAAPIWAEPASLAWYNTRLSTAYRVEARGESGRIYPLHPAFFGPYADIFTMGSFGYLSRDPRLVGPYGITKDMRVAVALAGASSAAAVRELTGELGAARYDAERARAFVAFLSRYAANRNARGERYAWTRYLRAPPFLWSHAGEETLPREETIRAIDVECVTKLFDGGSFREIARDRILTVEAPPASGG